MGSHDLIYPENSMVGFRDAYKMTNYCECDVKSTSDGVIAVYHDVGFDRVCLKYHSRAFSTTSWKLLKELEILSKDRKNGKRDKIPLLTELLSYIGESKDRILFVELKDNIGKEVMGIIDDLSSEFPNLKKQINIISQHFSFLKVCIEENFPEIGFISHKQVFDFQKYKGVTNFGFNHQVVNKSYFEQLKKETGIASIWVWNPRTESEVLKMAKLGVCGMGSNDISRTRKFLKRVKI